MPPSKMVVQNDAFAKKDCPFRFAMSDPKCQADRCAMWAWQHHAAIIIDGSTVLPAQIVGYCTLTRKP